MTRMLFITADIEVPHLSFYTEANEEERAAGFGGKWAWAEADGRPPLGCLCFAVEHRADAEKAADYLRSRFCGLAEQHAETITVTEFSE